MRWQKFHKLTHQQCKFHMLCKRLFGIHQHSKIRIKFNVLILGFFPNDVHQKYFFVLQYKLTGVTAINPDSGGDTSPGIVANVLVIPKIMLPN